MGYTYEDNSSVVDEELEEFNYTYVIMDNEGDVRAICCDEQTAKRIVDALNSVLNPHEKE